MGKVDPAQGFTIKAGGTGRVGAESYERAERSDIAHVQGISFGK